MVDRYKVEWGINSFTLMDSDYGDLVKYEDYAKLEAENNQIKLDLNEVCDAYTLVLDHVTRGGCQNHIQM